MPTRPTKADLRRLLDAVTEKGLPIGGVEMLPDFTIRVIVGEAEKPDTLDQVNWKR